MISSHCIGSDLCKQVSTCFTQAIISLRLLRAWGDQFSTHFPCVWVCVCAFMCVCSLSVCPFRLCVFTHAYFPSVSPCKSPRCTLGGRSSLAPVKMRLSRSSARVRSGPEKPAILAWTPAVAVFLGPVRPAPTRCTQRSPTQRRRS